MPAPKRKPGRPAKVRPVAHAEPLTAQLTVEPETLPDNTTRQANPTRLAECAPELCRIADKVRMIDARTRQGIGQMPRAFVVRSTLLVAYIYGERDDLPDFPAPIV